VGIYKGLQHPLSWAYTAYLPALISSNRVGKRMYGNYEGFHKCHTQCQPPPVAEIIAPIGHSIHEEICFHVIVGGIPNG
jgi:hypothetical protein